MALRQQARKTSMATNTTLKSSGKKTLRVTNARPTTSDKAPTATNATLKSSGKPLTDTNARPTTSNKTPTATTNVTSKLNQAAKSPYGY